MYNRKTISHKSYDFIDIFPWDRSGLFSIKRAHFYIYICITGVIRQGKNLLVR